MTFLHPWVILLGLFAAGIPLAVHFLTKPRPVRFPLSTLRFLREAVHQRRARHLLRDVLILAFRTLAVLLIALAIARPQWGERPQVSEQLDGDTVRLVALDVSQSMAATDRGVAALERARTAAAKALRYRPGLKANLMFVGARSRAVFETSSVNFDQLREELAQARVLPERVDARQFVEVAARILSPLSPEDRRRRELVIISDFQRSGWAGADLSPLPEGTLVQWESVAPATPLSNLALVDVRVDAQDAASGPSRCEIDVYNGSPHLRNLEIELRIGSSLWNVPASCPAGSVTTLAKELRWNKGETGWRAGRARLLDVDDALEADNVRPFVVRIPEPPRYVLITRQPETLRPSSSHFLQSALTLRQADSVSTANGASSTNTERNSIDGGPSVQRIDPAEIDPTLLAPADLILLDHPGKLPETTLKLLAGFLRRGRPLLYVASESVDAGNLKSLLDAAGESVHLPVEFLPPRAGSTRRDLRWVAVKRDRPPFDVFGDHLGGVLEQLRFSGGLESRRIEGRHDDDVLAVFNDGSAGVVLATSDFAALAVINADLTTSNLPRTAAFVPLLEELLHELVDRGRENRSAPCGEPLFVQLSVDAGPSAALHTVDLDTAAPDVNPSPAGHDGGTPPHRQNLEEINPVNSGDFPHGELLDEETGTVWQWNNPGRPGVFAVKRGQDVVFAKAVTIPPEESELESLDMAVLAPRLAGGHATSYRNVAEGREQRDDSWIRLLVGCLLCMLAEVGTMIAFRD